jgi:hypothetical protein
VRMKVARSELMFSTPTFAKIAVNAAKTADASAQNCQDESAVVTSNYPETANFTANSTASTITAGDASFHRPVNNFISA